MELWNWDKPFLIKEKDCIIQLKGLAKCSVLLILSEEYSSHINHFETYKNDQNNAHWKLIIS